MLTANQTILLRAACSAPEPITTQALSELPNEHAHPFGESAARNGMARMEKRGLVLRSGAGMAARWTPTAAAHQELGTSPAPQAVEDEDSSPSKQRPYFVFEEVPLGQAVREALVPILGEELPDEVETLIASIPTEKVVYDQVTRLEARNAEHAYRQAAKDVYGDEDAEPLLVAVATKMFQPTRVRVRNRQTVSVG